MRWKRTWEVLEDDIGWKRDEILSSIPRTFSEILPIIKTSSTAKLFFDSPRQLQPAK
jgi:hypothetical protein